MQLEQNAYHFQPFTGQFARKMHQFIKFLLKFSPCCAILSCNMGWCACSLMWKYSTIAGSRCQAFFCAFCPRFRAFFFSPVLPAGLFPFSPRSLDSFAFCHLWQLIFCRNSNLTNTDLIFPAKFMRYFLFCTFQKSHLCELFLYFFQYNPTIFTFFPVPVTLAIGGTSKFERKKRAYIETELPVSAGKNHTKPAEGGQTSFPAAA